MADVTNLAAVDSAKAFYKREMDHQVCSEGKPYLIGAVLRAEHGRCRAEAHNVFHVDWRGGPELAARFIKILDAEIQEAFKYFELINDNKKHTAYATNSAAVDSAKALYRREMEKICGTGTPSINGSLLLAVHGRWGAEARRIFDARKMGGTELTAQFDEKLNKDIQEAFKYFDLINDNKKQTANATNSEAAHSAIKAYYREMHQVCGKDKPFMNDAELRVEHRRCRAEARSIFLDKKMGGPELEAQFVEKLNKDIQKVYKSFEHDNNYKRERERQRERERADEERVRANRERERAERVKERANRERERAEREKERANRERERQQMHWGAMFVKAGLYFLDAFGHH